MRSFILPVVLFTWLASCKSHQQADIVLYHGKIITVDSKFTIAEAVAVKDGKIIAVGSNNQIEDYIGANTEKIDLHNRTVVPGLIDEHAHPVTASQSELAGEIPDVHTISQLLNWISSQTALKKPGEWIIHPKFFITRMLDMRQLTLRELDSVAPDHPVFLDGSFGGMVNTEALKISNLLNTNNAGVLRSAETGKVSGFIHSSVFPLLAIPPSKKLSDDEAVHALQSLFVGYNKMGITSICSGGGDSSEYALYEKLLKRDSLNVRIFHNYLFRFPSGVADGEVNKTLDGLGKKTGDGDDMLKVGSFKLMIDGGVLTGTAYLREGWGTKAKKVYGINDPNYRGNIFYSEGDLRRIISIALKRGWKFSAHVTGGGGVDTLLDAFEKINESSPIKDKRFSVIHGNFFTPSAIDKMAAMNIYADMQPAWYLKDADLLNEVLGADRLATFHPYRSMIDKGIIINGGSDHMVKVDPNSSVNPYNPFLAMWSMVTRKTERGTVFNPEQAITREEALKAYTINNAMASFEEKVKGSLEPGKFADLAVLSDDILACSADSIKSIHSVLTMLNGKIVYKEPDSLRVFCGHEVMLDKDNKLLPRKVAAKNPYDHFLRLRWNFVQTKTPDAPGPAPRSNYPQYYFYCAFIDSAGILLPDHWMNDVGEKVPMWLESARLYRDYSGDEEPLKIAKGLADYSLAHGITAPDFSWPNFPYTTTNAGDLEFRGFTARFALHDLHVDHAGDLGATYYKMYLLFKDEKYRDAAIKVANVLADKVQPGTDTISPWPYVVNAKTGKVVSWYGTNWFGCIRLFDMLIADGNGHVDAYTRARSMVKNWLLKYPFKNGKWVDGHTDTYVTGTTNLSNLSASNAGLYVSDHPSFTSSSKEILPSLIKWTEDNFVFKSAKGEPSQFWGANIVSEQVAFMPKMDYQTARYAAQCAKWYRVSRDESYKEKAFRALNFVTYCNDSLGKVFESPFSKGVNSWWSDSYGECPIMFYHALAAIPSWAPAGENHILYSGAVLRDIVCSDENISYDAAESTGTEYLRVSFKPAVVAKNALVKVEPVGQGDYYVVIERHTAGSVKIVKAR